MECRIITISFTAIDILTGMSSAFGAELFNGAFVITFAFYSLCIQNLTRLLLIRPLDLWCSWNIYLIFMLLIALHGCILLGLPYRWRLVILGL
jgi:hypothetical protein